MPDPRDLVKVNAPGDPPGQPPNVYDEADAVYSAAHYLALNGLTANPSTWHDAIWRYNHADWYVSAVLERAQGYYAQSLGTRNTGAVFLSSSRPASCPASGIGGYVNPFGPCPIWTPHRAERIDMGVHYADNSPDPILALGDAVISYAGQDPGWETATQSTTNSQTGRFRADTSTSPKASVRPFTPETTFSPAGR